MFSVLIVEDNKSDREGIRDLIRWGDLGLEIVDFGLNGADGLRKAIERKPDFVLTDISMPIMDGITMTRKIKENVPDTRFVFMSCHDDFDFARNAIDLDVNAYVLKPIDLDELSAVLEKMKTKKEKELASLQMEQTLQRRIKESIPLIREQFFRDLLYGKHTDEARIREQLIYLELDGRVAFYTVVILEIDHFDSRFSNLGMEHKFKMMHRIQMQLEQNVMRHIPGLITFQQNNSFAIALFSDANTRDKEDFLSRVIRLLTYCKEQINQGMELSVSIGISQVAERLADMPKLLENAEYTARSKFYSAGNLIMLASELRETDTLHYNMQNLQKEILLLLEREDETGISRFIESYYKTDLRYPEKQLQSLALSIVYTIESILLEKNESVNKIFGDTLIWEKTLKFETVIDLKDWLIHVLITVKRYIAQRDNKRYEKIVHEIKKTIDEQYNRIENIEQVVSPLYMSVSYANVLFKQLQGQTIFDYLIRTRMEAAKKMLEESNDKIYQICEKTGYKSTTYFGSVFRQYTGLMPKEYRNKYYRGSSEDAR